MCDLCTKCQPRTKTQPRVQTVGTPPFEDLEVDFTEVKPYRGCKYLLVIVCTYSGWAEAYPTCTEWARTVAKAMLRDIIPRYGLPLSIVSDNGPACVSEIIQTLSRTLGIKWKLYSPYRPQSSGKVEHTNQTRKTTLAKLRQETQLSWLDMLPLALFQARYTLRSSGYFPFEILYGRTPPVIGKLKGDPQQLADLEMSRHLQALGKSSAISPEKP